MPGQAPPAAMPGMASGFPPEQGAGPGQQTLLALLAALMGGGEEMGEGGMPGAPPIMPGMGAMMPGAPPPMPPMGM